MHPTSIKNDSEIVLTENVNLINKKCTYILFIIFAFMRCINKIKVFGVITILKMTDFSNKK